MTTRLEPGQKYNFEDLTHCFYTPGDRYIYGMAVIRGSQWQTLYGNETIFEIERRYPEVKLMPVAVADGFIEKALEKAKQESRTPVQEIDQATFDAAFNILPPMGWWCDSSREVFRVSEALIDNIRSIYCRIGKRYFTLTDSVTNDDAMRLCFEYISQEAS